MKKLIFIFTLALTIQQSIQAQCNPGLNLGAVIVPTHGNAANNGNFASTAAWQEAASWIDTFNLDYRQPYITWTDVVTQITANVPTYNNGTIGFQNQLNTWAGNPDVHVVYSTTKVGIANTLEDLPAGFGSFTSFLDPKYIDQNYYAIKHILTNVNKVKWISIGNEIETYFGGAYLNTGRITQYAMFLDTIKKRIKTDFPTVKIGAVFAYHTLVWQSELSLIDSVLNSVDYVGYTFYYTTNSSGNCWDSPATVQTWLNSAKAKTGSKKMLITETCMGDGGGTNQNCGSPTKQLAYADTLLRWYNTNKTKIEGMTWFTITDPYLDWQTSNTIWNTCGLTDSSGIAIQPAGTLWSHQCQTSGINSNKHPQFNILLYPNPTGNLMTIQLAGIITGTTIISVYNSIGIEISRLNTSGDKFTFDTSDYPNGIYYFHIENSRNTYLRRIIIAR
ncbi:MAG: T9SS type A sorting domain-containing protein [Bacteroidetes bacterium]|nr:T9SS type A sorting domain-containing protein [Bacteroidota bacterium]